MKTLAIVSHKGGAGKTSSAVMLAEDFARRGLRVVLVDADRQRGAGLILGLDQPSSQVQQTRNPKLRYLCSTGLPLRELPSRHKELEGLFDVAVVDTPSLDDPLARGWIQLSTHVLMVVPVEPVSMKTLDAADNTIDSIHKLNETILPVGILPTMFDETNANQRTLMMELRSRRSDLLPNVVIPSDSGLAHRAEQKEDRRTEASEGTRKAYQAAGDLLARALQLGGEASAGQTYWNPAGRGQAGKTAQPQAVNAPAAMAQRSGPPRWLLAAAVVALLILGLGVGFLVRGQGKSAARGARNATRDARSISASSISAKTKLVKTKLANGGSQRAATR